MMEADARKTTEHNILSTPIGTLLAIMQQQFRWIPEAVFPAFRRYQVPADSR
jgi:hypothetical protein